MSDKSAGNIMWRESLCLGNDVIDEQHRQLFKKALELLTEANSTKAERKQTCTSIILFLKDYAIKHFADEEAFQKSIGYKDFEIHKKIHDEFKKDVGYHEAKLVGSDFADNDVKEFTGMLIAWILYHVSDADQRIVKTQAEPEILHSYSEIVCYSISNMWDICSILDSELVKEIDTIVEISDDMFVIEAKLKGDATGHVTIVYPPDFVKYMVHSATGYEPETVGELEKSLLLTVSNFTFQTISELISKENDISCYALPSVVSSKYAIESDERLALDTGKGIVSVGITINIDPQCKKSAEN